MRETRKLLETFAGGVRDCAKMRRKAEEEDEVGQEFFEMLGRMDMERACEVARDLTERGIPGDELLELGHRVQANARRVQARVGEF